MTTCSQCKAELIFDHTTKGYVRKDGQPHTCDSGNGKHSKPADKLSAEENHDSYKVSPTLDEIHREAVFACKKYLAGEFENAPEDKKIIYLLHYENLVLGAKQLEAKIGSKAQAGETKN